MDKSQSKAAGIVDQLDEALARGFRFNEGIQSDPMRLAMLQGIAEDSRNDDEVREAILAIVRQSIDERISGEVENLAALVATGLNDLPEVFGRRDSDPQDDPLHWPAHALEDRLSDSQYAALVERVMKMLGELPVDKLRRMYDQLYNVREVEDRGPMQFSADERPPVVGRCGKGTAGGTSCRLRTPPPIAEVLDDGRRVPCNPVQFAATDTTDWEVLPDGTKWARDHRRKLFAGKPIK